MKINFGAYAIKWTKSNLMQERSSYNLTDKLQFTQQTRLT